MSEEIKLGWYQQNDKGGSRFRVVFIRDDGFYLPILGHNEKGYSNSYNRDHIKNWTYLGPKLPPQSEWVDIDLTKVTLADLPIKARFSDDGIEWIEQPLTGFIYDCPLRFFSGMEGDDFFEYCQVWRPL